MVRVSEKFLQEITLLAKDGSSIVDGYETIISNLSGTNFQNQSSVPGGTPDAGKTTLWARDIDGYLVITDDLGVDRVLATQDFIIAASGGLSPPSNPGQNTFVAYGSNGDLAYSSAITISGTDLSVSGALSVSGTSELNNVNITGDGYISNNLTVSGTLTADLDNPNIIGDGYVSNDFTIGGKLTVGGLIDPTGLVLQTQASVPGGNPVSGDATLWVRTADGYGIITDSSGTNHIIATQAWVSASPSGVSGAANLGTGAEVFLNESGGILNFREIASADSNLITATENGNDIDLDLPNIIIANEDVAVGIGAATGGSGGGNFSVAVGAGAGGSLDPGSTSNTLIGFGAGASLTTGSDNTFIGTDAGGSITTGTQNTIVGSETATGADGANNTIFGYNSGGVLSSGGSNVIIGSQAGSALTTGSTNLIFGTGASTLTTGSSNILIGSSADTPASGTSNFLNLDGIITGDRANSRVAFTENTLGDVLTDHANVNIYGAAEATLLLHLESSGANSGSVYFYAGDRDPEGNVPGDDGYFYWRESNTLSSLYVFRGASPGTSGWEELGTGTVAAAPASDGYLNVYTPNQITSDQNNYNIPSPDGYDVIRMDGYDELDADRTITGIVAPGGLIDLAIVNIGTNNIVFAHESASSTAENRFLIAGSSNLSVPPNGVMTVIYDDDSARWRVT